MRAHAQTSSRVSLRYLLPDMRFLSIALSAVKTENPSVFYANCQPAHELRENSTKRSSYQSYKCWPFEQTKDSTPISLTPSSKAA